MGIYQHTYLGPYLKVRNLTRLETIRYRVCVNEKCKQLNLPIDYEEINFCSNCGGKIEEKDFSKDTKYCPWDALNEVDEFIDNLAPIWNASGEITKGYSILAPNKIQPNQKDIGINIDSDKSLELDLSEVDILDEVSTMHHIYNKEIKYLKNKGFEIDILWGLLIFFS